MESFPLLELPKELIYLVMSKIKEREDFINLKKTCKFLYYNKNVTDIYKKICNVDLIIHDFYLTLLISMPFFHKDIQELIISKLKNRKVLEGLKYIYDTSEKHYNCIDRRRLINLEDDHNSLGYKCQCKKDICKNSVYDMYNFNIDKNFYKLSEGSHKAFLFFLFNSKYSNYFTRPIDKERVLSKLL